MLRLSHFIVSAALLLSPSSGSSIPVSTVDLDVTKVATPDPAAINCPFNYVITVTNEGPDSATTISLTDDLPPGLSVISLPAGCTQTGDQVNCSVAPVASEDFTQLTFTVSSPTTGVLTNSVSVTSADNDTTPTNNSYLTTSTVGDDCNGNCIADSQEPSSTLMGVAGGNLYGLNITSGTASLVGTLAHGAIEAEINSFGRGYTATFDTTFVLQAFDPYTGVSFGPEHNTNSVDFEAMEYDNSVLYGVSLDRTLYEIFPEFGEFLPVGPVTGYVNFTSLEGMAYDPVTDTMYAIDSGTAGILGVQRSNLYTLDLSTGILTFIGNTGIFADALEIGPDGRLYAANYTVSAFIPPFTFLNFPGGELYAIDKNTAGATLIGNPGIGDITALALRSGSVTDCNGNGIPDSCEIAANASLDCNNNGTLDSCEIQTSAALDCNENGLLDSCEITANPALDCNNNGTLDSCETTGGLIANDADGRLYNLDPRYGYGTPVGSFGIGGSEIEATTSGTAIVQVGGGTQEFDPQTGALIGSNVPNGQGFQAFEYVGPVLYGVSGNVLFTLDPATGSTSLVAPVTGITGFPSIPSITGLAYDPATQIMYAVDGGAPGFFGFTFNYSKVYTLDLVTGAATVINPSSNIAIGGLDFGPNGKLYAITRSYQLAFSSNPGGDLYTLDKSTGVASFVGQTGLSNATGLANAFHLINDANHNGLLDECETAANDAPSGKDKTVTISEDNDYTFAASDFGFSDPNDSPPNAFLAVELSTLPAEGTVRWHGASISAGDLIPATDLTHLTFSPETNKSGTPYASFTFQVQDDGGTTSGGVDLDQSPNTFTINVTPVNDPPLGSDTSITIAQDSTHIFTASDFGFSDPNDSPPNAFLGIQLDSVPAAGTLKLSGAPIVTLQFVTAANISGGSLTFEPAPGASGVPYASFQFRVRDDGGGTDTDVSAKTITINVTSLLTATLRDTLTTDTGIVGPTVGDGLRYDLAITNGATTDSLGTRLTMVLDPHTSLTGLSSTPFAEPDYYQAQSAAVILSKSDTGMHPTGTVGTLFVPAPGVLQNDFLLPTSSVLTVQSYNIKGTQGSVVVNTDGSFTYTPPGIITFGPGTPTSEDHFAYTLRDNLGRTDSTTVTIMINNAIIPF